MDSPKFEPGRWWRVIAPDGSLWGESSDAQELREGMRPGDRLERIYERTERAWCFESEYPLPNETNST